MLLLHSHTACSAVPRQSPSQQVQGQEVTLTIPQVRFCAESLLDAVQTVQTAWGVVIPSKYMFFLKEARQQTLEWECRHPQRVSLGSSSLLAAQHDP